MIRSVFLTRLYLLVRSGLEHPIALAFDNDGNLFVAEDCVDGPDSIYKFNPDGSKTLFATGLNRPTALALLPFPNRRSQPWWV